MNNRDRTILVVGASANPQKYGRIILANLISRGFDAVPINPKEKKILEKKVYTSISEYVKHNPNKKIEFVDLVLQPEITLKVLEEISKLGIRKVWLQPGSESEEAIEFCKENGIKCVSNMCVMEDLK